MLKALTYAPTGGIVAAATTSLPEALGGVRNWDYRYCWIRDATLTLFALAQCGYAEEALAFRDWLLRASAGAADQLQIMYGVAGERRLPEQELEWLPGYEGASPVRAGNAAVDQFQLDVYGEMLDLAWLGVSSRQQVQPIAWKRQVAMIEYLEEAARLPDEGIWEVRGPRRHFVHSKVMAWVAFDRAVKIAGSAELEGPLERWQRIRDELHTEICSRGFDAERNTFTQSYGSRELDASLLIIPAAGFLPPTTRASSAPSRRCSASCCRTASCTATDGARRARRRPAAARRARSCRARSGSATRSRRSAATTRRWPCSSGCSASATTSGCSPRSTTPRPGAWSATSPRRSPTSRVITTAHRLSGLPAPKGHAPAAPPEQVPERVDRVDHAVGLLGDRRVVAGSAAASASCSARSGGRAGARTAVALGRGSARSARRRASWASGPSAGCAVRACSSSSAASSASVPSAKRRRLASASSAVSMSPRCLRGLGLGDLHRRLGLGAGAPPVAGARSCSASAS